MQPPLLAPPVRSALDTRTPEFQENRDAMLQKLAELETLLDEAELGGGVRHHERLAKRGKLPVRERIALALDPDSPFLEISSLAGYNSDYAMGGGAVLGIGVIAGVECVIFANDPTVLGGALTPYVGKKWMRALEIARDNHLPYVSFVESAGADLRMEPRDDDGKKRRRPAKTSHFAETGRFFYEMIELSKLRIPTVCVVFGSSTAGGAYQPGMSDYNVVIKQQSKIFLAGPPLVKMATGEDSDDETLGGAQMHADISGLGEYLAEDERDALRLCREIVSHLNWHKPGPEPTLRADPPALDPEELLGILDPELRRPVEIREVIGRIVDGSRFEEFKPRYGPTLVCGFASIHGYPVGILGNNGVLYPDSAEKGAHFVQLCNQIDMPLVFLQNLTGFIVGRDYEQAGMIKKGSQLINAVTNSEVPHLTVIVGASYGAGTYAMSGRAFNNRFTFIWPSAKIAVMGGKQIAGVMSIVRRGQAARKGEPFDEEADAKLRAAVEAVQEKGSIALEATGAISDDGLLDPRDTRTALGICLSVVRNKPIAGAAGYGVFRL
ncbi:MAG: carboxyl transferase domain-containing protein [Myxococcota bacterium]|jgi:acetyl-CoA carboxylase carboxyltransferase component|nr:acetyl-CoA carboxylase carboxyltransferase subunit [Deltaproteobacteria bacterium]MCP4245242.1 acyl-CoA carboxylase subunit beta [bacterium]MDP6073996.1 carboxyl transferase domain-containing protein [Myxococcota bacterium]MDP6241819.1 carboxyl transferase domain-containing protein [Myxococcota bacterium]MDP7074532.1 carboxyl transferase domain-containing protein [Myxococcota bacterium]